jgi:hypothetical protein
MPTFAGISFELQEGEQVVLWLEATRPTRRDKELPGVLVVTDRRVLFARAGGWTTFLRGPIVLDRRRADLVDVRTQEGGSGMRGPWPAEIQLTFAGGKVERVRSMRATQADFQKLHELVEPAHDRADDPKPPRTIGVVTERTCSACRPPCSCASPNPIPTALVGWGRPFDGDDRETKVIDEGLSDAPVLRRDVVEIAYLRHDVGHDRSQQWGAIVRLADDRWALVKLRHYHRTFTHTNPPSPRSHGFFVDHTVTLAASLERVWWEACTDSDRAWFDEATGDRDEEMIRLDEMLASDDAEARAYAEARMRQLVLPTRRRGVS